jgi:hypothetical protein
MLAKSEPPIPAGKRKLQGNRFVITSRYVLNRFFHRINEGPIVTKLPPELWIQIFEEFDIDHRIWKPRTTLAYLSRTCRYINRIVEPLVYSIVPIELFRRQDVSLSCITSLESKPHLIPSVRRLSIYGGYEMHIYLLPPNEDTTKSWVYVDKLYNMLPHMTNLRQLTCIVVLMLPSLHRAVFFHPSLRNVVILSPYMGHLPAADHSAYVSGHDPLEVVSPTSPNLEKFATNKAHVIRALLLSNAVVQIRFLTITICHAEDRIALSNPVPQCRNLVSLSLTGLQYDLTIERDVLPCLTTFSGTPSDARRIVSERSITELSLIPPPHGSTDLRTHDIHLVPDTFPVIAACPTPLRSLFIAMGNPLSEVLQSKYPQALSPALQAADSLSE